MLCDYGCGREANFTLKNGKKCCSKHWSSCEALRKKNSLGLMSAYKEGVKKPMALIYSQLPQETKDKMNWSKGKFIATSFTYGGKGNHKGSLIQERGHKCEKCLLTTWLEKPITLELEHIDGNNRNNVKSNLLLLCPNCHSYTATWRGRNINSGKVKVTDEQLLSAYDKCKNIRQALLEVGLAAKGGNYLRLKKLIEKCLGGGTVYTADLK